LHCQNNLAHNLLKAKVISLCHQYYQASLHLSSNQDCCWLNFCTLIFKSLRNTISSRAYASDKFSRSTNLRIC
jgi:hypothetical protein